MKQTTEYTLIKRNTDTPLTFIAYEEEGYLLAQNGHPMVVREDVLEFDFQSADFQKPLSALTDAQREIVLRIGDNRGHHVERRVTPAERRAREKTERDAQNAFLRQHGYRWEKRRYYASGPGDMWEGWFLLNAEGEVVRGEKEIGEEAVPYGRDIKDLLTELGYYGEDAKAEREAAIADRKMRRAAREAVDAFFKETPGEPAVSDAPPFAIDRSPNRYKIDDTGIFMLVYNGSDGDDWSRNNDGMHISSRYPLDTEITAALELLKR